MIMLYLSPGVFDKGGIARYGRFQIRALREAFGEDNVKVLSLMGRQYDDLEEPLDVDFAGAMPIGRASRVLFAAAAIDIARRCRPELVLSAHVNLGLLSYGLAKLGRAHFAQNVYGRELWVEGGLSPLKRTALARADVVISDCYNTADRAMELEIVNRRPEVIWDCVDTERYSPGFPDWKKLELYGLRKNGRFKVMFLGRINSDTRYKGFERLLHMVADLSTDRFEAVLAGKGDDLDRVKALSEKLGIADRTVVTGAVDENDMPDIYRSADAFYLVSEVGPSMGEGIPLTPMEAMSCGVPVLVGNRDGSRELLDGSCGWCGVPSDIEGQRAYTESLAANRELHEREKIAARQRAMTVFGYERFAEETVAVIERSRLVGHRKGSN